MQAHYIGVSPVQGWDILDAEREYIRKALVLVPRDLRDRILSYLREFSANLDGYVKCKGPNVITTPRTRRWILQTDLNLSPHLHKQKQEAEDASDGRAKCFHCEDVENQGMYQLLTRRPLAKNNAGR